MKAIIFALLVAAAFASTGVPTVTVCSAANALLQNLQYTITPNNIEPGSDLKVTVSGTLTQAVTTAELTLSVSFDGIPILSKNSNLCKEISCPVKAGPFSYTVQHEIPNLPVSGTVDAKAVINAQDSLQVACVDVSVSI